MFGSGCSGRALTMNEKQQEVLGMLCDAAGRTDDSALKHLWREKFGRKLESVEEVIQWLCAEHGMQHTEAENLQPRQVLHLLRPDASTLSDTESDILAKTPPDEYWTGQQIAKACGEEHDAVRKYLGPNDRLRRERFIEKNPKGYGYRRL
jgi:hypothetical protein